MTEKDLWNDYGQFVVRPEELNPWSQDRVIYYDSNSLNIKLHNQGLSEPDGAIIIPAFNEAVLLPRALAGVNKALASLHGQHIEVIVVDNNSQDATGEIAQEFGARVVRELELGVGNARQTGLEYATSTVSHIFTTDADCVVPGDWVNNHAKTLAEDNTTFSIGNIMYRSDDIEDRRAMLSLWAYSQIASFVHKLKQNVGYGVGCGNNSAFRYKDALLVGGYNIKLKKGEDSELLDRMTELGRVVFTNNVDVSTSGRRILEHGVIRHGIVRLTNNALHFVQGSMRVSEEYENIR